MFMCFSVFINNYEFYKTCSTIAVALYTSEIVIRYAKSFIYIAIAEINKYLTLNQCMPLIRHEVVTGMF